MYTLSHSSHIHRNYSIFTTSVERAVKSRQPALGFSFSFCYLVHHFSFTSNMEIETFLHSRSLEIVWVLLWGFLLFFLK